jgi:hypothetical protein
VSSTYTCVRQQKYSFLAQEQRGAVMMAGKICSSSSVSPNATVNNDEQDNEQDNKIWLRANFLRFFAGT